MFKKYEKELKTFVQNEHGAITIDYMVLMAGMIGLAVAGTTAVRSETATVTGQIAPAAADVEVASAF
ncbi:MAG: hypothetical protein P8L32_00230 [Paracoccaceae bacterium]|jgi:hypothetical protein|nr:hypothetical protein [Paracoccaceae bacterium]